MSAIRAVVFDLYGTLVQVDRPVFQRGLRKLLDIDRRAWTEYVLTVLLVTPFDSREEFLDRVLAAFESDRPAAAREAALALLDEELASAHAFQGVPALLAFLKRRGLRLGLLSNLASPYRQPFETLGLSSYFDAVAFSCDRGRAKPEPRMYLDLCRELGAEPHQVLMVGDSLRNDVTTPRRLGMRSLRVTDGAAAGDAVSVFGVGWLAWEADLQPLVAPGRPLRLGEERVRVQHLAPVPDRFQGRYNLVMAADAEDQDGSARRIYMKRYLLPESAYVEEFMHLLLQEAGIETPTAGILSGPEPILWSLEAPGERVQELILTPDIAFDVGRHGAAAFLFANADYRPRNAFLVTEGSSQRLMMVDYEHCLFNLALDVTGIEDPCNPHELDDLGPEELAMRVRRRVISPRTCRRNYREFFGRGGAQVDLVGPFREGWIELTRRAQERRANLEALLRRRIHSEPFLIIGTHSYRRAMAGMDIEDLLARLTLDPAQVLDGWMQPIVGA